MTTIFVAEEHDQILDLWRDQQAFSLRILHMDAHCDLRGMLIDRNAQRAYSIRNKNTRVDPGNFLTQAIIEGRISSLRWVYDEPGGRQYDVGTVKYETDLTSIPYRCLIGIRGKQGIPIQYKDVVYTQWNGLIDGEYLDIDWDFFASIAYTINSIQSRIDAFLAKKFCVIPDQVYICYSPDFSHPSRIQFQRFIDDLAKICNAEIIELQSSRNQSMVRSFYRMYLPRSLYRMARKIYYMANLNLKRWGIY